MVYELLAYYAGSLILFYLSSKGVFIAVGLVSLLVGAAAWWVCGIFGRLWYVAFRRNPLHWMCSGFAAVVSVLFVWVVAASAYVPQVAMVSTLVWRAELAVDAKWRTATFRKIYEAVKEAGHEDFTKHPPPPAGETIPASHAESKRLSASIAAGEVHRHFRERRPLLSRVFWSDPAASAERTFDDMNGARGGAAPSDTKASLDLLLDIAADIPLWSQFLEEIDGAVDSGGILGWYFEEIGAEKGIRAAVTAFDEALGKAAEATGQKAEGSIPLDRSHALLANEILQEARDKSGRVRAVLILGAVASWVLLLVLPLAVIGRAARREADLGLNRPGRRAI